MKSFSSKIRNKSRIQQSTGTSQKFNKVLEVQAKPVRSEKEITLSKLKLISKLSLFADDTTLYLGNPRDSTKMPLELINYFSKMAGYIINIQKSTLCVSTTNYQQKKLGKHSHQQIQKE